MVSNECQHDRVKIVIKNLCFLVQWKKEASACERVNVKHSCMVVPRLEVTFHSNLY